MVALLGLVWMLALVAYGVTQLYAAWVGADLYIGTFWTGAMIVGCLLTRFTLPLTVFAFLGAWVVWLWPWYWAALFAAPGLAFMLLGLGSDALGALTRRGSART